MQRDHLFGYPPATMAAEPAPAAPRYPLGRPTRDPEPAPVWPFPLVKPAVTFVADSRTMDSDMPGFKGSLTLPLKEKPAQAEPQADAGWIEHTGDTPPQLKDDTMIFVRTRDGDERGPVRFGAYLHFAWMTSDNHPLDILSYRVVPA